MPAQQDRGKLSSKLLVTSLELSKLYEKEVGAVCDPRAAARVNSRPNPPSVETNCDLGPISPLESPRPADEAPFKKLQRSPFSTRAFRTS